MYDISEEQRVIYNRYTFIGEKYADLVLIFDLNLKQSPRA